MSKKLLVLSLFLFIGFNAFSQNKKVSLELNFPIPFGDNFIGENYNGIVDAGIKYRFVNTGIVNVGASLNAGILRYPNDRIIGDVNITAINVQPRVFVELNAPGLSKFHPSVGVGYNPIFFRSSGTLLLGDGTPVDASSSDTRSGVNFNVALAYDIFSRFFIQAQYDFTKLSETDGIPSMSFNTNVNILKLGVGLRI